MTLQFVHGGAFNDYLWLQVINSYMSLLKLAKTDVFVFPSYLGVLWDNRYDAWLFPKVRYKFVCSGVSLDTLTLDL